MKIALQILVMFAAFFAAFAARNCNLENRAPHADEGEQAATFMKLFESGEYSYNPHGPHGPTLYYYADAAAKISGGSDGAKITIAQLRQYLLPVLFLIFAILIFGARDMGRMGALWACAAAAMCPLVGIYSAYFVQEIILAMSVLGLALATWGFFCRPSFKSAVFIGLFAGFAQATKETALLFYAGIVVSTIAAMFMDKSIFQNLRSELNKKTFAAAFLSLAIFALIFCAFYSSFGKNFGGLWDAFASYAHFSEKAGSEDFSNGFLYYFKLLTLQTSSGVKFGCLPIAIFALCGLCWAIWLRMRNDAENLRESAFVIFLAANALFTTLFMSFVTYKTPWLLLTPAVFMCAVAGYGIAKMLSVKNIFAWLAMLAAVCALGWWQYRLNYFAMERFHSDPRNPFLFTHTVPNYGKMIDRIKSGAKVSEYENDIPIAFITGHSPWPAPWDLRTYRNAGFWSGGATPQSLDVFEIIVCDSTTEPAVLSMIRQEDYVQEFFGLRDNYLLTFFMKKGLFNKAIEE